MKLNKLVLTIATGKSIYIQMAVNLARSFKWWHKNSDIKFAIATDQAYLIPPDLSDILIIELQPNQYGQGFSPKLHLDKISPADNTLFVDADCLCVGSLESVFDRCKGHTVSVIGKTILEGDFLQKMVEKVSSVVAEKNPSPDSNPVDMAMDLMKSGVFSDMVNTMSSGASNGKLDINKMFTTVTTMINKMSPDGKVPPEIGNMISMISTIIPSSGVVNNTGSLIEQLESVTVEEEVENNAENTGSKLE